MVKIRVGNQDDINNISQLLIDTWQKCYIDFIPSDYLNSLNLERQIQRHTNYMLGTAKYFVVENNCYELIGFSSYGKNRIEKINCDKELYTIYVKKNHQGEGIGKLLLNAILRDLKNENHAIAVSVFEKNPFRQFYLKNGFVKTDEEIIDMGKFELIGGIYIKSI